MSTKTMASVAVVILSVHLADAQEPAGKWVKISDPIIQQLTNAGKKIAWPGQTAGVAVDPANGDVYMIIPDQGVWKSTDLGRVFARADEGEIGGRCETGYSINVDPAGGGRLAFFMLDGKCAMTLDRGKTWQTFKDVGRNWDFAAVDWRKWEPKAIFAARHESGGEMYYSKDAGKSWKLIDKDPKYAAVGIFDETTLVTTKGEGILRSTDAGTTWEKVSDLQPTGRLMKLYKSVAYWIVQDGLITSTDEGKTWKSLGSPIESGWGPFFSDDPKHFMVCGRKGFFETRDAGTTWTNVGPLPPVKEFDDRRPGWFLNVGWDPTFGILYASRMGFATYKAWQQ
jgi:hypothetical protein